MIRVLGNDLATSFMDRYGPYGFGVAAVVVLVVLGVFVITKCVAPLLKLVYDIQSEQTKQTTNLREAAQANERTAVAHASTSASLAAAAADLKHGSGVIQRG